MVDVTLLELHVHDGLDFHPSPSISTGGGRGAEERSEGEYEADEEREAESGGGSLGKVLGALAVALVLGFAAKKLASSGSEFDEELETLDQPA